MAKNTKVDRNEYPDAKEGDEFDENGDLILKPDDPRRRFRMNDDEFDSYTFYNPGPITAEEKALVEAIFNQFKGETPKKSKK